MKRYALCPNSTSSPRHGGSLWDIWLFVYESVREEPFHESVVEVAYLRAHPDWPLVRATRCARDFVELGLHEGWIRNVARHRLGVLMEQD